MFNTKRYVIYALIGLLLISVVGAVTLDNKVKKARIDLLIVENKQKEDQIANLNAKLAMFEEKTRRDDKALSFVNHNLERLKKENEDKTARLEELREQETTYLTTPLPDDIKNIVN